MHIEADGKNYEERCEIYHNFLKKYNTINRSCVILGACFFVLFLIFYVLGTILKINTMVILGLICLSIVPIVLCIVAVLSSIFTKKNCNLYLDLIHLYNFEKLIDAGSVEANIEIVDEDIKNDVIGSNISKVEITKDEKGDLIANIRFEDGFELSKIKVSSNDLVSFIGKTEKEAVFGELVNNISLEQKDNRYYLYLAQNAENMPTLRYEAANKEKLANLIKVKNM